MEYKLICKTDQIILLTSGSIIFITKLLLPFDIWLLLIFISFFVCWLGWEYWWSIGYTPQSYDYHERAIILKYNEVTNNIIFHSIILAISDVSISLYIFSITTYLIPVGLTIFKLNYTLVLIFFALFQNKIITLSGIIPITSNMSWAPLAFNSTCYNRLSCWNNQQEWLYGILIIYFFILMYNLLYF